MMEALRRIVPDGKKNPGARLWFLLALIGFVAMLAVGGVSLVRAIAVGSGAGAGDPIPAISVASLEGSASTLDQAASGKSEIVIVVPSCEHCAAYLQARAAALEASPETEQKKLEQTLLVVTRDGGLARDVFMSAFNQLKDAGVRIATLQRVDLLRLGVRQVPARIPLTRSGRMGAVEYLNY